MIGLGLSIGKPRYSRVACTCWPRRSHPVTTSYMYARSSSSRRVHSPAVRHARGWAPRISRSRPVKASSILHHAGDRLSRHLAGCCLWDKLTAIIEAAADGQALATGRTRLSPPAVRSTLSRVSSPAAILPGRRLGPGMLSSHLARRGRAAGGRRGLVSRQVGMGWLHVGTGGGHP